MLRLRAGLSSPHRRLDRVDAACCRSAFDRTTHAAYDTRARPCRRLRHLASGTAALRDAKPRKLAQAGSVPDVQRRGVVERLETQASQIEAQEKKMAINTIIV